MCSTNVRDDSRRLIATWSPPRLAPGAQTLVTLTLPGADLGDPVVAGFSHDLRGQQLTAYVGAKNSVTVVLRNGTAAPTTLPPGRVESRGATAPPGCPEPPWGVWGAISGPPIYSDGRRWQGE